MRAQKGVVNELKNQILTAGVIRQERGHVVDLAADRDKARLWRRVLLKLVQGDGTEGSGFHCGAEECFVKVSRRRLLLLTAAQARLEKCNGLKRGKGRQK